MKNILYILNLIYKLFLINQIMRKKFKIIFINDNCHILKNDNLLNNISKINNIYILSILEFIINIVIII